jgi:hypothetical protein
MSTLLLLLALTLAHAGQGDAALAAMKPAISAKYPQVPWIDHSALVQALDGAHPLAEEEVRLEEAAGRVLARTITSPVDVPPFPRSAMDGYAIRRSDTVGATKDSPVVLNVVVLSK